MANNSHRTSTLGIATTLQSNDRVLVLTNPNTAIVNTQTITLANFVKMAANTITGPFANDAVANTNGVAIKTLYYDTSGTIKIRLV